jgi:hypothetical protein
MTSPHRSKSALTIVGVDRLSECIVVLFSDGKEFVYPVEVLHAIIPTKSD